MSGECVCAIRGYCADVAGDPLACPVCVQLGAGGDCPAALLLEDLAGVDDAEFFDVVIRGNPPADGEARH